MSWCAISVLSIMRLIPRATHCAGRVPRRPIRWPDKFDSPHNWFRYSTRFPCYRLSCLCVLQPEEKQQQEVRRSYLFSVFHSDLGRGNGRMTVIWWIALRSEQEPPIRDCGPIHSQILFRRSLKIREKTKYMTEKSRVADWLRIRKKYYLLRNTVRSFNFNFTYCVVVWCYVFWLCFWTPSLAVPDDISFQSTGVQGVLCTP